jgi:hypothetical protein
MLPKYWEYIAVTAALPSARFCDAWKSNDGTAVGSFFSDDGTLINPFGEERGQLKRPATCSTESSNHSSVGGASSRRPPPLSLLAAVLSRPSPTAKVGSS